MAPHEPGYSLDIETTAAEGETNKATIARLAKLDLIAYDQVRENEAKRLVIRVSTLDTAVSQARGDGEAKQNLFAVIRPADDPVDGPALLDEIAEIFRRHLVLSAGASDAIALWVLHAHTYDTAEISPILCITSPTPECGKSTLLSLIGKLAPRPLTGSNLTSAVVFRAVAKWAPTLLIDEADSFLKDNEELRGVLNSGHSRSTAYVLRVVGEGANMEPARFSTWAPKAIALIGKLPATLASRSVHIEMRRMMPGEVVEPYRSEKADFTAVVAKAIRWAKDNDLALRDAEPEMPESLNGRRSDNWRHLLALADLAGGHWPTTARQIAMSLSARHSETTTAVLLLEDIQAILDATDDGRITSAGLVEKLTAIETRPWGEWSRGKPITSRQLARMLALFGIAPENIRIGQQVLKGYDNTKLADTFSRYLHSDPLHRYNPYKTGNIVTLPSATNPPHVADDKLPEPAQTLACSGVADEKSPEEDYDSCRRTEPDAGDIEFEREERAAIINELDESTYGRNPPAGLAPEAVRDVVT